MRKATKPDAPSALDALTPFERAVLTLLYSIERNTDPTLPDSTKGILPTRQPLAGLLPLLGEKRPKRKAATKEAK